MPPPDSATAAPPTEPIVDPLPSVITQFDVRWGKHFVRPPLDKDGDRIETAADLPDAFKPDEHTWTQTACHVVSFVMLVNWLANQNPLTKGKLVVPNLDLSNAITPPHVAFALFKTFENADDLALNADQADFVSSTNHPPYIPFKKSGKTWQVDHERIRTDFRQLKLKTDAAPDGEPVSQSIQALTLMTPSAASGHAASRKKLLENQQQLQEKIAANEAQSASLAGSDDPKDKVTLANLQKAHAKLLKQKDQVDSTLATNPVDDAGNYVPERVELNRRANKQILKRALLRGPVLLNMTISGHFTLLVGYRGRDMYIVDPGRVIQKHWFKAQPDVTSIPAQIVPSGADRNTVKIDGEAEFTNIGPTSATLAFLDNLLGCESYFFSSVGDQISYNTVALPGTDPLKATDAK